MVRYEFEGEILTLREIASLTGKSYRYVRTLHSIGRLSELEGQRPGMHRPSGRVPKAHYFEGNYVTSKEISSITGVPKTTVNLRIRNNGLYKLEGVRQKGE